MDNKTPPEQDPELLRLLDAPGERLNIEIKGWLDLKDELDRANLAKATLALANHGGGRILIGWSEHEGNWVPDNPHPKDLSAYSQDSINGIVSAHAEPIFHCQVTFIKGYPVVLVPGGHRVPIRAKRDGPDRKHVQINSYYIRRPGPKSESPQTASEWDQLIRRCLLAARDDLLDDFRKILLGHAELSTLVMQIPTPQVESPVSNQQQLQQALDTWRRASGDRFRSLVEAYPDIQPRYEKGTWSATYVFGGNLRTPSLRELLDVLVRAERHETGWPLWWVPSKDELKPYPVDGNIEC